MNQPTRPKVILALDDERPSLDLVRAVFRRPRWKLICLDHEESFHQAIAETQPDLILLDHNMPHKSGMQLCAELRAYDSNTPVVFLTADQDTRRESEALSLGAQGMLRKPIAPHQLRQYVENHLSPSVPSTV